LRLRLHHERHTKLAQHAQVHESGGRVGWWQRLHAHEGQLSTSLLLLRLQVMLMRMLLSLHGHLPRSAAGCTAPQRLRGWTRAHHAIHALLGDSLQVRYAVTLHHDLLLLLLWMGWIGHTVRQEQLHGSLIPACRPLQTIRHGVREHVRIRQAHAVVRLLQSGMCLLLLLKLLLMHGGIRWGYLRGQANHPTIHAGHGRHGEATASSATPHARRGQGYGGPTVHSRH